MVDIHKPSDYPIILGDSLKDGAGDSCYTGIRYNWIPPNGFTRGTGTLRSSSNDYSLSYEQGSNSQEYTGWLSDDADQNTQLALIYDNDRSAFVLERVSASLNFNVKSSSELSAEQIKRHPQLEKPKEASARDTQATNEDSLFDDAEDEPPDDSNPFDFRHFLAEAKESVEKPSHQAVGGRTPVAGARTPMNGISSPVPGNTSRFPSTTPQFAPTEIRSVKRKLDEQPAFRRKAAAATKGKSAKKATAAATSRPRASSGAKQTKPLSAEVVVDSSDEDSDASAPSPPPSRPEPAKPKAKAKSSKPSKSHARTISAAKASDDDDDDQGGLEIVDDSPPLSAKRKAPKINAENFRRGQTSTPNLSNPHSREVDMHDPSDDDNDNENNYDNVEGLLPASDDEISQNGDVPDLILEEEEEESEPEPLPAPRPKRRQSSTVSRRHRESAISMSTSMAQPTRHQDEDEEDEDDDDGGLAAALEEALEREAQMQAGEDDEGFGDVGGGGSGGRDEESEISEED